jgi:CBS domain-containing protein
MTAGEVCNRHVVIAGPDMTIVEAADLMKAHHVGDLVVVPPAEGGRVPIGILTDRDIALSVGRLVRVPQLKVADLMTVDVVTSTESENLHDVLKKMQSHGVRRLPIVNSTGGLEGILTFDDLVELLSEELTDLARLVAREQKRERSRVSPET